MSCPDLVYVWPSMLSTCLSAVLVPSYKNQCKLYSSYLSWHENYNGYIVYQEDDWIKKR